MAKLKPIPVGRKFNKLTILEDLGTDSKYIRRCLVECECGVVKKVAYQKVKSQFTKSCGCYVIGVHTKRLTTHGQSHTKLYKLHSSMLRRCHTPTDSGYYKYGAKGITVCNEWRESFESFYSWSIENGFKQGLTIDREDGRKGYSPDNCRWVNHFTQAANKDKTIRNTSGVKGIHFNKSKQKWVARVTIEGKRHEFTSKLKDVAIEKLKNFFKENKYDEHLKFI